jgi:hypothetical protein
MVAALKRWRGNAALVAETKTAQITGGDAGTTYKLTRNGKTVSFIGSAVVGTIATGLAAAWNASTEPEMAEYTATALTDTVTLTQKTAGHEFGTVTSSVSGAAGTIGAVTSGVVNSGPNDVAVAANYADSLVPVTGDTLYVSNIAIPLKYNLDQSGVTLVLLQVDQSFEADIGLPEQNQDGTAYIEDRPGYYKIGATSLIVGRGAGQGSGRLKIDNSSIQTAVVVENTGSPAESNLEAFLWKGTHASNSMVVGGNASVGVAVFLGEVATLTTLTVKDSATVRVGAGVTLATVVVYGGNVTINCAITTSLTQYGGTVTINGTGVPAQLNIYGGVCIVNTTGTVGGNTVVGEAGLLDYSQDPRAKAITNPVIAYNANPVNDPNKVIAALAISYRGTTPLAQLGSNLTLTRTAAT